MLNRIIRISATTLGTLFIVAGCSKASYDPAPEQESPISFDAGSAFLRDDALTKTTSPLPSNTKFGVFAYTQPGTVGSPGTWNNSTRTPDCMFNVSVLYKNSKYTYSPVRFWPASGTTLSFWAYSPWSKTQSLLVPSTSTAFTSASTGIPDLSVTVNGHTDFCISDLVKNQSYANTNSGSDGVVNFLFNHTLSLIDVNVQKDDSSNHFTVQLNSVRFDGIYMTGVLRWNDLGETWNWAGLSGSRQNATVFEDNPNNNGDDIILGHLTTTSLTSTSAKKVMLLPQSLSNDACRLHIEFTLTYTTHDDDLDEDVQHVVPTSRDVYLRDVFSGLADVTWVKNAHYTLTITISPNKPILFTVSWSSWGDYHNYSL